MSKTHTKKSAARLWLECNANDSPLASNRFGFKKNALSYVAKLESLGAENVEVLGICDEPWRIRKEKGPYATTIQVTMPNNKTVRKRLFAFLKRESKYPRTDVPEDHGQKRITLWWD